jgi:hypothetical protein
MAPRPDRDALEVDVAAADADVADTVLRCEVVDTTTMTATVDISCYRRSLGTGRSWSQLVLFAVG